MHRLSTEEITEVISLKEEYRPLKEVKEQAYRLKNVI
jgi:hypothetical protein